MRLAPFLAISALLHLLFFVSLPSLTLSSTPPPLKKPIWVELQRVKSPPPPKVSPPAPEIETADATPVKPKSDRKVEAPQSQAKAPSHATASSVKAKTVSPPSRPETSPTGRRLSARESIDAELPLELSVGGRERLPDEIEYEKYLLEIKKRVEANWKVSVDDDIREGTTVIWAVASADGSLRSIDVIEPSGMIVHDYEALEAVKQAFPLRTPPATLLDDNGTLPIRFSFHYLLRASR